MSSADMRERLYAQVRAHARTSAHVPGRAWMGDRGNHAGTATRRPMAASPVTCLNHAPLALDMSLGVDPQVASPAWARLPGPGFAEEQWLDGDPRCPRSVAGRFATAAAPGARADPLEDWVLCLPGGADDAR